MNNLTVNSFIAAQQAAQQAPLSAALGQAAALGNGDNVAVGGAPVSFAGVQLPGADAAAAASVGAAPGGVAAADLDQLQQAYNRTGDRGSQHHPIAEFLYQLTKMLTDDNSEIIEWVDGRIKVHYPERLEAEVLHKYFRHSKFASFQRQLNYFGFRKIAGKGKMSPCSYVNEAATSDIRSLLLIKRKTNGSAARKAAMAQRTMQLPPGGSLDLRANLSALAAGAAAATGAQPGVNRLGSNAFNAAALFSQAGNPAAAAAAGLGQFPAAAALQQKTALAAGGNLFLSNENAMQLLMQGAGAATAGAAAKPPSADNLLVQPQPQAPQVVPGVTSMNVNAATVGGLTKTPSAPSIEQLHAQLAASLANRQTNGLNPQLNPSSATAALGLASNALNNPAAVAAPVAGTEAAPAAGPASAALVGGPASAALGGAASAALAGPASAALGGAASAALAGPASAALAGPASAALGGAATAALGGAATAALGGAASAALAGPASAALAGPASAALNATAALNSLQQQQSATAGGGPATAAAAAAGGPASAALNAAAGGAASAALNAAAAGGAASAASLFDSATNLKALVGDQKMAAPAPGQAQLGASAASQQLLNARLPSSSALFPENLSTMSFGNLLGSSNRLSSLLSLNSFLSRDPSVADLVGVLPQGQLTATQTAATQAAAAAGINDGKFTVPRFQ